MKNCLVVFFLTLGVLFFHKKETGFRPPLCTLAVALTKEDAWVIAGAMAFYFFVTYKKPIIGFLLALGSFVFLVYSSMFLTAIPLDARYAYLGHNFSRSKNYHFKATLDFFVAGRETRESHFSRENYFRDGRFLAIVWMGDLADLAYLFRDSAFDLFAHAQS